MIVLLAWLPAAGTADACSIAGPEPVADRVANMPIIFVGVATTKVRAGDDDRYEVEVRQVYKGSVGPVVVLRSWHPRGSCEGLFVVSLGTEMLIFAERKPGSSELRLFWPFGSAEDRAAVERLLGPPQPPDGPARGLSWSDSTVKQVPGLVWAAATGVVGGVLFLCVWWRTRRRG